MGLWEAVSWAAKFFLFILIDTIILFLTFFLVDRESVAQISPLPVAAARSLCRCLSRVHRRRIQSGQRRVNSYLGTAFVHLSKRKNTH